MPHSQNRWANHYTIEDPDGNPIPRDLSDSDAHSSGPNAYTYTNPRPEYDEDSYRHRDEVRSDHQRHDRMKKDSYSPPDFRAPDLFHETAPSSDGTFHREPDTSTYSYTNPRPEYSHRDEERSDPQRHDRMREDSYRPTSYTFQEADLYSDGTYPDPRSRNDTQARNHPSGFRHVDPRTIDLPRSPPDTPSYATSPPPPRRQSRPAYERWSTYPLDRRHGEYMAYYAEAVYDIAQDALAAMRALRRRECDGGRTRSAGRGGGGYRDRDRSDESGERGPRLEVWVRSGDGVWEEFGRGETLDGEWLIQRRRRGVSGGG